MQKNSFYSWWRSFPYLLGAALFFFGAVRFLIHDDYVGVVIYTAVGLLSLWQAVVSYLQAAGKQNG